MVADHRGTQGGHGAAGWQASAWSLSSLRLPPKVSLDHGRGQDAQLGSASPPQLLSWPRLEGTANSSQPLHGQLVKSSLTIPLSGSPLPRGAR